MKIGDLATRCGLSAHTLRYYERIGLLPRVPRDGSRQRDYDPAILEWIEFLRRLKTTGMPIRDMLRYARLREQGAATEGQRRRLLEDHRDKIRAHAAELTASLAILERKIEGYAKTASPATRSKEDARSRHRNTLRKRQARPGRN